MNQKAGNRTSPGVLALLLVLLVFLIWTIFRHSARFHPVPVGGTDLASLPGDLARSVLRLFAAYFISLVFAYVYGLLTALTRWGEKILLPLLDILQSIPVLGFFPAVIFLLIHLFRNPLEGVELASVILIATSMAWNMAFAVFESIRTAPVEYKELLDGMQAPGWLRLVYFLVPVTIPKMVYNSILSWAQGWYFLIACEMISMGSVHYRLRGLGSFLVVSTSSGKILDALAGIVLLVVTVVLMDFFLFRPVVVWSQRFSIDQSASLAGETRSVFREWLMESDVLALPRRLLSSSLTAGRAGLYALLRRLPKTFPAGPDGHGRGMFRWVSPVLGMASLFLLSILGYSGVESMKRALASGVPWDGLSELPLDMIYSMLRLLAGYLLSLCWTVPVAWYVFVHPRLMRTVMPVAQVMASVPATALFPFIIVLVVRTTHSMNLASILLLLSGMQWYLLFNLLAGAGTFPNELREAALTMGVRGRLFLRKIFLPFLFPSIVTGSITAFGGGWNALIVSEYVVYDQKNYSVRGIGAFLDKVTYGSGNEILIVVSLLMLTVVVVTLNRFFWTPLYERVTSRYGLDG